MGNIVHENRHLLEVNNYVRKATSQNDYWFDFSERLVEKYRAENGDAFNLILYGSENKEDDFYVLPFDHFKHIFSTTTLSDDGRRWIGNIRFNELQVRNAFIRPDVAIYYGNFSLLHAIGISLPMVPSIANSDATENDYAIENRRIEIMARQKQSLFRRRVLENFEKRCCISGTEEENLLVASHIVPWADRIDSRLDPSNGLCLSVLYDALFDQGYFSLSDSLHVIITLKVATLSNYVRSALLEIKGRPIKRPLRHSINVEFIRYHREHFLQK